MDHSDLTVSNVMEIQLVKLPFFLLNVVDSYTFIYVWFILPPPSYTQLLCPKICMKNEKNEKCILSL